MNSLFTNTSAVLQGDFGESRIACFSRVIPGLTKIYVTVLVCGSARLPIW
jgi:hypothetical protein